MTPTITSIPGNYLLWLMLLTGLVSGCMKEDTYCPVDPAIPYTFMVRAYAYSGEELTADDVGQVWLYLFDQEEYFERIVETSLGESVELLLRPGEAYHLIGWGNLGDNSRVLSDKYLDEFSVTLRTDDSTPLYALTADDLFRGSLVMRTDNTSENSNTRAGNETVLPIYRQVGSLRVSVSGLKEYTGYTEDHYHVIVGETPDGITFSGELTESPMRYRPESGFATGNGHEQFRVPTFNLLPQQEGIYMDLYYQDEQVIRIDADESGQPLIIEEGRLTEVEVDLSRTSTGETSLSVTARLRDWGSEEIGKEF